MTTPTDPNKRFLNFPLVLLAETITDPWNALERIACFAVTEYGNRNCQPEANDALIQAMYCESQRTNEPLPSDVEQVLRREDVDALVGAIPEHFGGGGDTSEFIDSVRESIGEYDIELNDDESDALTRWCKLRRAVDFFGRTICNADHIHRCHADALSRCEEHKKSFKPLVWCSVPAQYLWEIKDQERLKDLPILRAVAALRSIIGKHHFTGTTKAMIYARMIGAKSEAAANHLCSRSDSIRTEYKRLQRRRQFDNLLTDVACRGFVVKIGMARRIYLSTDAESPKHLAEMVKESKRRRAYRAEERAARESIRQ